MICPYCQADNQAGEFCAVCAAELQQTEQPTGPIDTISATDLAAMEIPPAKHIVSGLIPRGLSVVAGRPKAGKSFAMCGISIAVAAGDTWHGCATDGGVVLYLAFEDTVSRLQARIGAFTQAPPANLKLATTCDGGMLALGEWMERNSPRLVVIDTLQRWRGGKASTYHRDYEEGAKFKSLADKHNCAVVVVHHTTKVRQGSPLDSVAGSTGLTGAADAVMVIAANGSKGALWVTGRDIPSTVRPMLRDESGRWMPVTRQIAYDAPRTWSYGIENGTMLHMADDVAGPSLARRILKHHGCTRFGRVSECITHAAFAEKISKTSYKLGERLTGFESEADLRRLNLWHLRGK